MRYAVIAALVGAALAAPYYESVETIYDTKVYTVTSCGADVVDCPGKKTSAPAIVAYTTAEVKPTTPPMPVVYATSSSAPAPAPPAMQTYPAPAPPKPTTTPCPTTMAVKTSPAPAPPAGPATYPAPAPPAGPVSSPAPAPPAGPATYPAPAGPMTYPAGPAGPAPTGTGASTGLVPYKTTSAIVTKTTSPAVYTGAASQLQVAGLVGAGAIAAFFL